MTTEIYIETIDAIQAGPLWADLGGHAGYWIVEDDGQGNITTTRIGGVDVNNLEALYNVEPYTNTFPANNPLGI